VSDEIHSSQQQWRHVIQCDSCGRSTCHPSHPATTDDGAQDAISSIPHSASHPAAVKKIQIL